MSKRLQRMSSNRRRKRVETQAESTMRNRRRFNVWKSTSFQRLEIDVVSTSMNRRRLDVYESTSFQRLWIDVVSTSMNRRRFNVYESTSFPCCIFDVVSMFESRWKCKSNRRWSNDVISTCMFLRQFDPNPTWLRLSLAKEHSLDIVSNYLFIYHIHWYTVNI